MRAAIDAIRFRDMTASPPVPSRRLTCARCGAGFECGLGGDCWCAAEPYRLPLDAGKAEDCMCPACLKLAAEAAVESRQ